MTSRSDPPPSSSMSPFLASGEETQSTADAILITPLTQVNPTSSISTPTIPPPPYATVDRSTLSSPGPHTSPANGVRHPPHPQGLTPVASSVYSHGSNSVPEGMAAEASLLRKSSSRPRSTAGSAGRGTSVLKRCGTSRSSSSTATSCTMTAEASTPSTTASTKTRKKLDEIKLERDNFKSLASRLKREIEYGPTLVEAENRLLKLKLEELRAKGAAPRRFTAGLFTEAYSSDVLFLMDTTFSMSPYIQIAKDQVRSMMADMLGGLSKALSLSWKHPTRCIIHIADAPPHGCTLHDLFHGGDNYPNPGSEPHGLTHGPLLKQMIGSNINYTLLRINNSTDRMAFTFLESYAAVSPNCSLLKDNKYYSQAHDLLESPQEMKSISKGTGDVGALQFEEAKLDTIYASLQSLVVKSVMDSATSTASRIASSSGIYGSKSELKTKSRGRKLTAIKEDEATVVEVKLETTAAQWDTPG